MWLIRLRNSHRVYLISFNLREIVRRLDIHNFNRVNSGCANFQYLIILDGLTDNQNKIRPHGLKYFSLIHYEL